MFRIRKENGLWYVFIKTGQGLRRIGSGYADKAEAIKQLCAIMYMSA